MSLDTPQSVDDIEGIHTVKTTSKLRPNLSTYNTKETYEVTGYSTLNDRLFNRPNLMKTKSVMPCRNQLSLFAHAHDNRATTFDTVTNATIKLSKVTTNDTYCGFNHNETKKDIILKLYESVLNEKLTPQTKNKVQIQVNQILNSE